MTKPKDVRTLVDLTKTTQALLVHYQSSLAPSKEAVSGSETSATEIADPLELIKSSTTLLKSHTTTLSLLLITPPLTPSAIIAKIGDVSSGPLSGMVTAASYVPREGQRGDIGNIMRTEVKAQVRRLLGSWGDVLVMILKMAEKKQAAQANGAATTKENGPTESEKQEVLSATGVVWEACDVLLKLCADGVVGLVVKKLGKDDKELKKLLDASVKKLKMIGMLYQALIKRRLKTYPASSTLEPTANANGTGPSPSKKLDDLMSILKTIPETVDDIAGAFYDLDEDEAKQTLEKCCAETKSAIELVRQSWTGEDDEFTGWSTKWVSAIEAA
ncbi:GCIP domain-containing protein [Pyrenophora tritici-repentis]|nr:GCIP domain-containing protein [Pyrenophora tritici-repentis]